MIYYDTETCGFHGPTLLIQWAEDDGPVHLHEVFRTPIEETLELIERFMESDLCGFNLAFDHFHLCQTYTTLELLGKKYGNDIEPADYIDEYAICEERGRFGPCLKPKSALDLMLHARKGPYQSTMDRSDIRLKMVPENLAYVLAKELDVRIPLKDVYFARYKDKTERWRVYDIHDDVGTLIPGFKDIVLKFAPSSALKALAFDALGIDATLFGDISAPKKSYPEELGYAPFALAVGKPGKWNGAYPDHGKIRTQIGHWAFNTTARKYAEDDVIYTRALHYYFSLLANGSTEQEARIKSLELRCENLLPSGDDDSELACQVAACRWKGYPVNVDRIKELRSAAVLKKSKYKYNFNSPAVCRTYITQVLDDVEKMVIQTNGKISTKGIILEEIAKWTKQDVCPHCFGESCDRCSDGVIELDEIHPAAERAAEILEFRRAGKEIELYDKILTTGDRLHPSFKVIGTLSSRMSGTDGLNPQGIKRTKEVRSCFTLYDDGMILTGGDFESFEVVLMDAAYGDLTLRAELQSGKKIHAIAGTLFFPGNSYEDILKTKGLEGDRDLYGRGKNGVFALFYGGNAYTLHTRVGIPEELGEKALNQWMHKYKTWAMERERIFDMFCSMKQPDGLGTMVKWAEPSDYIESMTGFKRYFTLENRICKELFQLAEKPPKYWNDCNIKVIRRDREQTSTGATRSALFACAFAIQAANMRAAANHVIQSTGATLTKALQRKLWDLQPSGIHDWHVQPMNVHDEIMCPAKPELASKIQDTVDEFINKHKDRVPLLSIDWGNDLKSWADK